MNHWLLKSDPDEYSAADLQRDGATTWDGVKNAAALIHMRAMRKGDALLIYHTGAERAVVATAKVSGDPQSDASDAAGKLVGVPIAFDRWFSTPVTLAAIKAEPAFRDFALVRIGRLSVMPVAAPLWERLLALGGALRRSPPKP